MATLKTVHYEGFHMTPESGSLHEVVYALYDGSIVFSGLHGCHEGPVTSTVTGAENVIEAILKQEGLKWSRRLRFFDLLTHRGYPKYVSGYFRFAELKSRKADRPCGFFVDEWYNDVQCPDQIAKDFGEYIGPPDPSIKVWKPDEAMAAGYTPTKYHSHNNGYWIDLIAEAREEREVLEKASARVRLFIQQAIGNVPHVAILVDHANHPVYLELSEGERYCIWSYNVNRGN